MQVVFSVIAWLSFSFLFGIFSIANYSLKQVYFLANIFKFQFS